MIHNCEKINKNFQFSDLIFPSSYRVRKDFTCNWENTCYNGEKRGGGFGHGTSAKTRQIQAEQTKLQIFEAAMRLLEVQDFETITVRDIVQEAHVSVGSFYNAYPSKLDVFYETYQVADNYFEQRVRPQLTEEDAVERIRHFFREYAVYNSDISLFALTKVLYNSDNACFHRENGSGMVQLLTECIQYGLDRGELASGHTAEEIENFLKEKMKMYVDALLMPFCTDPRQ